MIKTFTDLLTHSIQLATFYDSVNLDFKVARAKQFQDLSLRQLIVMHFNLNQS